MFLSSIRHSIPIARSHLIFVHICNLTDKWQYSRHQVPRKCSRCVRVLPSSFIITCVETMRADSCSFHNAVVISGKIKLTEQNEINIHLKYKRDADKKIILFRILCIIKYNVVCAADDCEVCLQSPCGE